MIKKLLYVKSSLTRPEMIAKVVSIREPDEEFSDRETAERGYPVLFGNCTMDITEDEMVLCGAGRRRVNSLEKPTFLVPESDGN